MTNDSNLIDKPQSFREGEELDNARLLAYLGEHISGLEGPLTIEQFPAGFSNLTYLLRTSNRFSRLPSLSSRFIFVTGRVLLRTDGSQIWVGW